MLFPQKLRPMLPDEPTRRIWGWSPSGALCLLLSVTFAIRLAVALASFGTNDVRGFNYFATLLHGQSLSETYQAQPALNHPPLVAEWVCSVRWLAARTRVPFPVVFKLFPIAADVVAAWVVVRWAGNRRGTSGMMAAWVFALGIPSILVTGYHGNTDSICALGLLLSAWACSRGKLFWAGVALGAALDVKLIPLVLVPALVVQLRHRRDLLRFSGGLAVALLPFVPILFLAPAAFYRNALSYNSNADNWGIIGFVNLAYGDSAWAAQWLGAVPGGVGLLYAHIGRYVVIAACIAWSLLWRRRGDVDAAAFYGGSMLLFLVLAPGFGIQYLVLPFALLCVWDTGRAVLYSLVLGIFMLCVYASFRVGTWPLASEFDRPIGPLSHGLGIVAWTMLAGWLGQDLLKLLRVPRTSP